MNKLSAKIAAAIARRPVRAVVLFLFLILAAGSLGVEITRINIRFAIMSEELAHHSWGLFPTINGHPYADYPILCNAFSYLTSFGGRWGSRLALVLPTICFGCYTVAMTAAAGERLRRGLGIYAALFFLLAYEYLNICLGFGIDVPVAAAAVTGVYFLLKYDFGARALPAFVLMLIFSFAVRGPFGLVLCGAVAAGCILGSRRWKSLLLFGAAGTLASLLCAFLAAWAIHRQGGGELWKNVLEWQIASRMGKDRIFYYFTNAMLSFAPATFFAIATLLMKRRKLFETPPAILLGWMLVPMILLSIPGGKHLRYMTPVVPAFALCAAYGCAERDDSFFGKVFSALMFLLEKLLYPVLMIGTVVIAIVMPLLPFRVKNYHWHYVAALAVMTIVYLGFRKVQGDLKVPARSACLFAAFVALVFNPLDAALDGAEIFTREIEARRTGLVYLYRMGPDHDDLKYIFNMSPEKRRDVRYLANRDSDPRRLLDRMYPTRKIDRVLPKIRENDVIVVMKKRFPELCAKAAAAGMTAERISSPKSRLGHREVVALRLKRSGTRPEAADERLVR